MFCIYNAPPKPWSTPSWLFCSTQWYYNTGLDSGKLKIQIPCTLLDGPWERLSMEGRHLTANGLSSITSISSSPTTREKGTECLLMFFLSFVDFLFYVCVAACIPIIVFVFHSKCVLMSSFWLLSTQAQGKHAWLQETMSAVCRRLKELGVSISIPKTLSLLYHCQGRLVSSC